MPTLFGGSSNRYGANKYTPNHGSRYFTGPSSVATIGGGGGGGNNSAARHGGRDSVNRHGNIPLKNLRSIKVGHTECRSASPSGSEEEIMTYNGIMRTTDVRVQYDGGRIPPDQASRASSNLKSREPSEKGNL